MNTTTILSTVAVLTATLAAQDDKVQSGPKPGMQLTKVAVYAATGPLKGKEFDAAAAIGQKPGALLFVKALNRETAPIIRELDNFAAKFSLLGFKSFTVFLSGDRTAAENTVQRTSRALRMRNPMTVTLDGAEGPGNYAINRDCNLTLVMVKGGVVVESIPFTDTGRKDIPKLRTAIEGVAGKLPRNAEALAKMLPDDPGKLKAAIKLLWSELARTQQQLTRIQNNNRNRRRPGNRNRRMGNQPNRGGNDPKRNAGKKREGKAPTDKELNGLIRALIQKDNTTKDIDAVFEKFDKRVGNDANLRKQVIEGLKLIQSLGYGTDEARKRAAAYRARYEFKPTTRKTGKKL